MNLSRRRGRSDKSVPVASSEEHMNEKATHMDLATSAVCTAWTGYRVGGGTDRSARTRPRRGRGGGSARQGMRGNRPTSGCAYLSKRADRPGCSLAIVHSAGCLSVVSAWTWAALVRIPTTRQGIPSHSPRAKTTLQALPGLEPGFWEALLT